MFDNDVRDFRHLLRAVFALLLGLSAALTEKAFADTTAQLAMNPERCVALNEGQTCFQSVTVNWQSPTPADYCLFQEKSRMPLMCWDQATEGEAKFEFASDKNVTFRLRLKELPHSKKNTLAETEVIVTWVYSKTKKRRNSWRLF